MNRRAWALGLALVLIITAVIVGAAYVITDRETWTKPEPVASDVPSDLSKFYTQDVSWSSCDDAKCADVAVPIDYDDPTGATTKLAVKVIPSLGGAAKRSIFVNPGGPGGDATDFADTMSSEFGNEVLETYDIVGVDPRGVGDSEPLQCMSDDNFSDFTNVDPDPNTPEEIAALRKSVTDLGTACEREGGELAAHVSTEEAARDMDVVRALLGRKKMDWFGASYGTQLGATYATLFPKTVGRMVLDGAVDPALSVIESAIGQATGFQRALVAFAKDCIKKDSCPLGNDLDAGMAKISDLMRRLDETPMETGDPSRELTEGLAFYGVAVTLYDKGTWHYLERGLKEAFGGDGTTLLVLSDAYFDRDPNGKYGDNIGEVIYAVSSLDVADPPTLAEVEAALPRFEKISPVFGRALGWGTLSPSDWPIKATHPQVKIDGEGAPPIIVVGTTRDPATPYEGAQSLAKQLASGVLISRDGDGHTAYSSGNQCISKAVDEYLVSGKVPKDGLFCKAE
ncbi:pimeloyl-ACP methyl ester carboxylesterase [Aeromicrobium panaciterrae]|uniref:Pimeloyl-ACP methyl ester carboxylesterase n=1 Tax=Aeromicrobium panaciterrae TaxID=363861 RepID=A0ABU1UKQ1_9ACTN|nr:alpha/beta hydrolase [Aeromicrobium panaciterrae]MDR7085750.1 pimeloyl-ACP methyl ester carboxylesterase [Aeromicrobium panaciterrae]